MNLLRLVTFHNHIISSMDKGKVTADSLFDISATLDDINYDSVLLHPLSHWFGLSGPTSGWFPSYLSPLAQSVHINQFLGCQLSCFSRVWSCMKYVTLHSLFIECSLDYHVCNDNSQMFLSVHSS